MSQGSVMKVGLKEDAKIFELDFVTQDLGSDAARRGQDQLNYYINGKFPTEQEEFIADKFFSQDQDAFTTELILQGYDGFKIKQTPTRTKESYLVVFNREALEIVSE
jgi:hypothetical protein